MRHDDALAKLHGNLEGEFRRRIDHSIMPNASSRHNLVIFLIYNTSFVCNY